MGPPSPRKVMSDPFHMLVSRSPGTILSSAGAAHFLAKRPLGANHRTTPKSRGFMLLEVYVEQISDETCVFLPLLL